MDGNGQRSQSHSGLLLVGRADEEQMIKNLMLVSYSKKLVLSFSSSLSRHTWPSLMTGCPVSPLPGRRRRVGLCLSREGDKFCGTVKAFQFVGPVSGWTTDGRPDGWPVGASRGQDVDDDRHWLLRDGVNINTVNQCLVFGERVGGNTVD